MGRLYFFGVCSDLPRVRRTAVVMATSSSVMPRCRPSDRCRTRGRVRGKKAKTSIDSRMKQNTISFDSSLGRRGQAQGMGLGLRGYEGIHRQHVGSKVDNATQGFTMSSARLLE